MGGPIIIWQGLDKPQGFSRPVILFDSFIVDGDFISLPLYLENNADRLRSRYLEFISNLGDRRIDGLSVSQHMDLGDGLSYWWMTTLAEKSPFKSPDIYTALLALALEDMLFEMQPSEVSFHSQRPELGEVVQGLCDHLDISCALECQTFMARKMWFLKLSSSAMGLASILKRFFSRYKATVLARKKWFTGSKNVSIFSYFTHLSASAIAKRAHYSLMWTELPSLLTSNGWSINWVQHYLPENGRVSLSEGLDLVEGFNSADDGSQIHRFLDSQLSISVILMALRNWFKLGRKLKNLHNTRALFQVKDSGVNLWPILQREWISSTSGQTAAMNCLWAALFDATLEKMPYQELGLYIHENQAWEHALLASWRKYQHGKIIAVQHATTPFWHLYYYNYESVYLNSNPDGVPVPDLWAVNGRAAYQAFYSSGYPASKLVILEALRYLSADGRPSERRVTNLDSTETIRTIRVLALGDLTRNPTDSFILALKTCTSELPDSYHFTYKPHPADNANSCEQMGLDIETTREPLSEILRAFDVVVGSHGTSATLDAYLAGLKVIVFWNGTTFNMSPLRGCAGVDFVSSACELIDILTSEHLLSAELSGHSDFFLADASLAEWERFFLEQTYAKADSYG